MRWTCVRPNTARMGFRGGRIKDARSTLRFWGVKFNGIMIVFVGGQIFNWFKEQKAQPKPLLHSLGQLKISTIDKTIRVEKPREPLLATQFQWGSLLLTNDRHSLFQRLGERLAHISFLISSEHTAPNEPFSSPPIKGIYCSSWEKLSRSVSFLLHLGNLLWLCICLSSVLLSRRVKVTSAWLMGRHPSAPRALRNAPTDREADRRTDWQSAAG